MEEKKVENLKNEDKSNWGGAREGSGRKPKLQYEIRELFNNAIDDEWENILKVFRYHIRRGDKEILKWVIAQRIGKARQSMDITTKGTILNISEPTQAADIMEIAKGVSEKLRKIKTD